MSLKRKVTVPDGSSGIATCVRWSSWPGGRAPATASSRCSSFVSSSFVCERPRRLWTKTMTVGIPARETSAASWSGPLGRRCDVPATSRIDSSASSISSSSNRIGSMFQIRSHSTSMFSSCAKRLESASALLSISASCAASRWRWSSRHSAVSTTEVTMPGLRDDAAHRADRAAADAGGDLAQLELELRGAGERVAPLVHRGRARVRRLAAPRDAMALDAERPEHDAEREVHALEHRPLLDVQLEVGGGVLELTRRLGRAVEVDPVRSDRIGQRDAVGVGQLPQLVLVAHRARGRARAEQRAAEARPFLVGPADEPDRDRRLAPRRRCGAAPRSRRRR